MDDTSATNFAGFLWGSFGPSTSAWTDAGGPRPFGAAVVDGFDFDIESVLSTAPTVNGSTISDYKTRGWASMVNYFKDTLFPQDTSKSYYLSAAPQCVVPDQHLSTVIAQAWFDFILVQFYNTAQCSARSAVASMKRATGFTGYDNWASASSYNADAKLYMGLAASEASASDGSYYLDPSEVDSLVGEIYSSSKFGGIMLWQATSAENNVICSTDYATWMKRILEAKADGTTLDTETNPCPAQAVSKDGLCGGYNGQTCVGSIFGSCCSVYGYCGDTSGYCADATCDPKGGDCGDEYVGIIGSSNSTSNTTSSSAGSTTTAISTTALNGTLASSRFPTVTSSAGYNSSLTSSTMPTIASSTGGNSSTMPIVASSTRGNSSAGSASTKANSTTDSRFCPSLNGQVYDSYTIQCNTNHYGVVINTTVGSNTTLFSKRQAAVVPTGLGDCLTLCDATTNCVGTAFNLATQTCTLFSTVGAAFTDDNVDFATIVLATDAGTTTTTTSTTLATSTVFATVTKTVTTTNAAGQPTVYVTEIITSYTTVGPATAAKATATVQANADYTGASTLTLYSTNIETIYSCAPTVTDCPLRTESQTAITVTSSYAVGTTVIAHQAFATGTSEGRSTSTTTQHVRQTSVIYRTIIVTSSTPSAASQAPIETSLSTEIIYSTSIESSTSTFPVALDFGPYAYANSSSVYQPTASAGTIQPTIIQVVTAPVAPVQQARVSAGVSAAPVYSGAVYNGSSTTGTYLPVFTGAAHRAEFGMGALAIAIGALIVL